MLEEMSLDEAIALFDRQGNANKERNHDRKQIAEWLRELKLRREIDRGKYKCRDCRWFSWIDCDHCSRRGTYDYQDEEAPACQYFEKG